MTNVNRIHIWIEKIAIFCEARQHYDALHGNAVTAKPARLLRKPELS